MAATAIDDRLHFFRMFLAEPSVVGAIVPSSAALATEIVRLAAVSRARTIVELGAGTGAITSVITREAPSDAMVISIEIHTTFARILSSRFQNVHVVTDSAERVGDYLHAAARTTADCVVSGLPWAAFNDALQLRLLGVIKKVLAPGGVFATFAYVHASMLPAARRFRGHLEEMFSGVDISPVIWRNLPPAFVYSCRA